MLKSKVNGFMSKMVGSTNESVFMNGKKIRQEHSIINPYHPSKFLISYSIQRKEVKKMGKFIDGRTSQNASYANSISIPILVINTPELFGQIGLVTLGATGIMRVHLKGTISVQLPLAISGITISIVRGTLPTDLLIYSATSTFDLSVLAPQVITFSADDYNPPITPQLTYTAFVSSNALGTIRVGPENFDGLLISD
jgi:hypothetical protein